MRKSLSVVAAITVSVAMAPSASAYEGWDYNNAHIVNQKSVYAPGELIHMIVGPEAGLKRNTTYLVGQCTWESHRFMFFPIPACGKEGVVRASTDENGRLEVKFAAIAKAPNAHKKLSGQPKEIDYSTEDHAAELVVIKDHGRGFRGFHSADTSGKFNVR